ncbi:extracellular solute-binding protein [Paenibacillaceae bacterium]|nr:extracellular solute-binding protein [Paenibacillaceae bacterium]
MRQQVKIISFILATLLFVAAIITGCVSDSSTKDAAETENTVSFSVTLPSFGAKIEDSMVHKEWIEQMESLMGKKLNIKYNYIPISEYSEKSKLLLASGDITDLFMIMDKDLYKQYENEGLFLDLSQYKNHLSNYLNLIGEAADGDIKAIREDGKFFGLWNIDLPRQEKNQGMGVYTPATYRYDLFKKHALEIPSTLDELYSVAKKLKELYPESYPINTKGFDPIFLAHHNAGPVIYWDGNKYVYGPTEESYLESLQFANKLYTEKLLDPEAFSDKDDAIKKKAMNGTNSILLQNWFTFAGDWNRSATGGEEFVLSLFPDNPKYGKAWQSVVDYSSISVNLGATMVINQKTKQGEQLVKLLDLQYKPEIIDLITWGIEGTSYTRDADSGKPTFVDSIKNTDNAWAAGDEYGMRASSSYRPGLQMAIDTRAFVDFAPKDMGIIDGKIVETPWETAFHDMPFPNDYTPPYINEPYLEFTDDERADITSNMSPITTYVAEMQNKFINGKESFDNWTAFQTKIEKVGDLDKVLQIYNDALKRYQDRHATNIGD